MKKKLTVYITTPYRPKSDCSKVAELKQEISQKIIFAVLVLRLCCRPLQSVVNCESFSLIFAVWGIYGAILGIFNVHVHSGLELLTFTQIV